MTSPNKYVIHPILPSHHRLTVSWNDSSVVAASYDGDCDKRVVVGLEDIPRIWTPDVYIYNAIDTVRDIASALNP